ncbi:MAG: Trk system potassium transporter TrkA [Candidatus Thermoplasmatota archaeon]|jgi:trk system potassium uptake protein TrkA|nr:Trk system potassium transporter TrkA [Candidatus Thermoplasmatota archaeon]
MNIIISGAGEVGCLIAETLSRVGHEITVIEPDSTVVDNCRGLDSRLICGNGAKAEIIESAGARDADFYFGLSADDEANMLGCVIAKSMGCTTLARINSLKYISEPVSKKFAPIGIDIAISPKLVVADKIAKIIVIPALVNRTSMAKGKMMLVEAKVHTGSQICHNAILNTKLPKGLMIGAIFRGAHVIIPDGKTIIRKDDHLVMVIDSPDKMKNIERLMGEVHGKKRKRIERVMIVGANDMAVHLAKLLEEKDVRVTMIEKRKDKCLKAAGKLKKTVVIEGEPTDKKLLLEEGMENMDAVVAMTRSEEFNILIALFAKIYEIPKVMSLLYRTSLKPMMETVGIDFAASVKHLTIEAVLKEIEQLDILRTVTLHGGELMVFETKVAKRSRASGKKIKDIRLPRGVLIVGIFRKGKTLIPGGDDQVLKGDRVIIFCFQEMMEQINRLFRGKGLIL